MYRQTNYRLPISKARGYGVDGHTIRENRKLVPTMTWDTKTALSVIAGYGLPVKSQCHSVQHTPLETRVLPRAVRGTISHHRLHCTIANDSEPFPKSKQRFNPFSDEPAPPNARTLCPKMADFLITEEFNQNPYPDNGQWDEDKAVLEALKGRVPVIHPTTRVVSLDGAPNIHQPQPVSMKDHADALDMILAYTEPVESFDGIVYGAGAYYPDLDAPIKRQAPPSPKRVLDGGLDCDEYYSDDASDSYDLFDTPSTASSAGTTPDSPNLALVGNLDDRQHLTSMEAKGHAQDVMGLGLPARGFKPVNFKQDLDASDLTRALQSGKLADLFLQASLRPENSPSLVRFPMAGMGTTDALLYSTPISP